jgi:translocator assembly and maintenance protein 41
MNGFPDVGQITSAQRLQNLVTTTFPNDELVYAFGYGSGVFSQELDYSKPSQDNLIDIILVVRDSYKFHQENLQRNPHHYTSYFFVSDPAARITWWQRHFVETRFFKNPKVYFNVTDGLKYGVVQDEDLKGDLQHWKYLYLAGRMHKPTVELRFDPLTNSVAQDSVEYYQQAHNLPAALSASLLVLQQKGQEGVLTPTQVFMQIASLSYTGDFRTAIGAEDPEKIHKLVTAPGQLERFHALYKPSIDSLQAQGVLQGSCDNSWSFDTSASALNHLWANVPSRLRNNTNLQTVLAGIVAPAARYQSMKGLVTAGFSRSAAYSARKLSKGILRFIK